jgi:hypothetical protein
MPTDRWWIGDSAERFWLEATDRSDIGVDLRAPETDEAGKDNWRNSLFKETRPGDIVVHYDKKPGVSGIVGFSRVAGSWQPAPIVWAARGTYAREKGSTPHERLGFKIPLESARTGNLVAIEPALSPPWDHRGSKGRN